MLKALAIKELREVLGIAAVALALYLVLVSALVGLWPFGRLLWGHRQFAVPFADGSFVLLFGWIAGLFCVALGFRQSAWEAGQGTFQFLLHRPLRRDAVFLTKLATGLGTFAVCTAVPLLLYVWWVATPGHHACPFEWSMTTPAWQLCLVMPVLYLGAFLSGLRPARWFGTRLLPLVGCALPVGLLMAVPWTWRLGLPLTLGLYALLAANICYVARTRDYS